jgi:hypothetical protein
MIVAARALLLVVMSILMIGCGQESPPPATEPPLLGTFRAPDGTLIQFTPDGHFAGSAGSGGRFSVDEDVIHLTLGNGQTRTGRRLGEDVIQLDGPKASLKFFRVGSTAAQTTEATTPPQRATATRPAKPEPDPSVPLDHYVPVTTRQELALLFASQAPSLTDEQKLALIPGPAPADAFARRDFLTEHWPAVEAKLAAFKPAYVRFDLTRPASATAVDPAALSWTPDLRNGVVSLQPYDLSTRTFNLSQCFGSLTVMGDDSVLLAASGPKPSLCTLPVPDEATARAIETLRVERAARSGGFSVTAQIYAFAPALGTSFPAEARVTHVRLSLYADRNAEQPLVTTDLPLERIAR